MSDKNRHTRIRSAAKRTRRTHHRKKPETQVFYSVQSPHDQRRLATGGEPWPAGLPRAVLGPGFYCWPTWSQANRYRLLLARTGGLQLLIIRYEVRLSGLKKLRTLDLTKMRDAELDQWMDRYSEYTQSGVRQPHGYDHLVRQTVNVGVEHYFSPTAFRLFKERGS
jgi:hypothetical protein